MNNKKLLLYVFYVFSILSVLSALRFFDSFFGPITNYVALWGTILFAIVAIGIKRSMPTPLTHVKCPECKELIVNDARVCRHCGCKLNPSN